MKLTKINNRIVESWWDRHTRSWVSQLKDNEGNQIGEAQYDGNKKSMECSHSSLIDKAKINQPIPE